MLERLDIPLNNNSSENDIRTIVMKRKILGSTRSDNGREARAIFSGIVKTCRKHGISSWKFIKDRLSFEPKMPSLADIIYKKAAASVGPPT